MPPDMVESELRARQEALGAALTREWKRVCCAIETVVASRVRRGSPEFHDLYDQTLEACSVDLLKQAAKYDPTRDVVPWVVKFAALSVLDVLRRRNAYYKKAQTATDIGEVWEEAAATLKPQAEQAAAEVEEVIQLALLQLDPDDRRIIEFVRQPDWTYDDLHKAVGGSRGGLRMRVSRARKEYARAYEHVTRGEGS